MRNLFRADAQEEIVSRVKTLLPTTTSVTREMGVTEMLAHCNILMETALNKRKQGTTWKGMLFGKLLKKIWLDKSKTGWCDEKAIARIHYGFEMERKRTLDLIAEFNHSRKNGNVQNSHRVLGKLTPDEWGILMYKHLDHHLRDFRV